MRPLLLALLPALLVAAPAAAQTRSDRAALTAAKPAGPPVSCVQISQIRETRVRSDSVIDFFMNSRKVYRNTLPSSCPRLGSERAFSYQTSISRLCNVDFVTVISRSGGAGAFAGPSCGLGPFQPVTGVKR